MTDHQVLTDEQIKEFVDAFTYFARGTDRIDRVDLKIIFESLPNLEKLPEDELVDFCDLVDMDGRGITRDPYLQLMSQKVKQDPLLVLKQAFMDLDKDGSGSIDRSELKEVMMPIMAGQYTEEEVDGLIDKADLDGDGEIDFEEFVQMMQEQVYGGGDDD